ncbi:MAG: molybdopterin molybdotransferase MoeA [Candidatus Bathyarchaeia archaeon]
MQRKDRKRTLKLVSYEEALKKLREAIGVRQISLETVPVESCVGRVLAEDIISEVDIPKTNIAIVDGYALRSEDSPTTSHGNPVTLRIVGKLYPWSSLNDAQISKGQTAYVTCGAPIPKGADAVVMVENTVLRDEEIELRSPVRPGEGVAKAGEDIRKGSLILKRGSVLRPQDVGVLAGVGLKEVKVLKKPVVAVIATGNELFELSRRDPAKIADNYALIVSNLIWELGGAPIRLGISPDDLSEIKRKISEALEKADIIVTIGGCSVGEKDLVPDAVNSFGKPGIVFHGIKVKPGRVTGFGVIREKPIVMLPGLISSTMAGFYTILAPLICLYIGFDGHSLLPKISAKINQDLEGDMRPIHRFIPVSVRQFDGTYIAEPIHGGASSLGRFVKSNGFILIPPRKALVKGENVDVTLFSREEFTHLIKET